MIEVDFKDHESSDSFGTYKIAQASVASELDYNNENA